MAASPLQRRSATASSSSRGSTRARDRKRRRALLLFGGAVSLAALAGPALSQGTQVRRIGYLAPGTRSGTRRYFESFRATLKDLGYVEGRDVAITVRWADDRIDRLPPLAAELVALNPDVILTAASAAVAALKRATQSIPIVFATVGDPVEQGFVSSLQRPGGNITGVMVYSAIYPKLVEIVREALQGARRLGIVVHETDPYHRFVLAHFAPAARRFKFEPLVTRVAAAEGLESAFHELARQRADAAIVPTLTLFSSNQKQVAGIGLKLKLPLFSSRDNFAMDGGLLSYGPPRTENYRRAAATVDKILKGAKPGDLAVEQPERFELVVNRKTAAAIGVKLSEVTMFRADRIID